MSLLMSMNKALLLNPELASMLSSEDLGKDILFEANVLYRWRR